MKGRTNMTSRERVEKLLAGEPIDRVPFEPAIYEHKAFLIGKTPSEVARSESLLYEALMKEYEMYRADFLVVGLDVYNVEAEALGSSVLYFEGTDVPAVEAPLLENLKEVKNLPFPDPEKTGRMPLFLSVAEKIGRELGEEVVVRGAVSGPFSLAAELFGMENLLIASFSEPNSVDELLTLATDVILAYAESFLKRRVGVVLFDSRSAPPLISPEIYQQLVLPHHKKIMHYLKEKGQKVRAIIIGGDTLPIDPFLAKTGANVLLADFGIDLAEAFAAVPDKKIALRTNLDPFKIRYGKPEEIEQLAKEKLKQGMAYKRFMMGTGIVPYDTPPENVKIVRQIVEEFGRWE